MKFFPTTIIGAHTIEIEPRADERGFFSRAFCRHEFESHNLDAAFVQANISLCHKRGTLRGLHWQSLPYGEAKLFRCTRGAIFMAIIDLRSDSQTYKRSFTLELNDHDRNMLFVPVGCASGYQALEDYSEAFYFVSEFYHPESEQGLRWDDPAFSIDWPIKEGVMLSPKDAKWPNYPYDSQNSPKDWTTNSNASMDKSG